MTMRPPTTLKSTKVAVAEKPTVPIKRKASFTDSEESDPEFINGAPYIEEPKKKNRQIQIRSSEHLKEIQVGNSTSLCLHNPLKEFLGSDLDIKSASESENRAVSKEQELEEEEEEEEEEYGSDVQISSSPYRKHSPIKTQHAPVSKVPHIATPSRVPPSKFRHTPTVQEDDSETEPETDEGEPSIRPTMGHKSPISPALRQNVASDDSATEPESDVDLAISSTRQPNLSSGLPQRRVDTQAHSDDSATEPDSDEDTPRPSFPILRDTVNPNASPLPLKQSRHPRPNFENIPSQPPVGPFVLDSSRGIQINPAINRWLRDYQREGVQFFYERYKEGRGGILGDDMGLGKTIQVIAFLSAIMKKIGDSRDKNRRQKHVDKLQDSSEWYRSRKLPPANVTWPTCLIIVPATVVHNWERELETWGYFDVGIYAGTPKQRSPVLRDFELGRLDIVIASIGLALKDIHLLESKAWSCVFIDEAHKVKSASSQTRMAFNRFDCLVRFGLTGTAIQNNYTEFWNILDWSNPGRLGTLSQWNHCITKPLTLGQDSKATPEQLATGRIVAERLVTRLLPRFFKRRTKDVIAHQLPKKIDQVVFCPLTETQIRVYRNFLNTLEVQTMLKKDYPCDCGSRKLGKDCHYTLWESSWAFIYISIFLKISNHLALILPAPNDTPEQTQRHREQANIGWPPNQDGPTAPSYGQAVFDGQLCGKWKVLKDLLTAWQHEGNNNKVLVFTKSVKLLEMLELRLKEAFIQYRKLDGSVKQADRMPLVDQFNDDPDVFVFLISIMAGGVGLNLVAANKVVIFDPNWNPAHDLQAQDRAFRFGQRRDVSVYRFLGSGSLEELIYKRQIYKQQQMKIGYEASHQTRYFAGVQGDKSKQGELFGLKNIFSLDESGTATKHTIERSHLVQLDWALTNLDGKSGSKAKGTDKVDPELRGLNSLLFESGEDSLPKTHVEEENDIHRILNSNGVNYTHHNESILKASTIETKLTKKAIESKRQREVESKRVMRGKTAKKKADESWPPKRKHHNVQIDRRALLLDRLDALIALGHITAPSDVTRFAEEFVQKPEEEQALLLGELDEAAKRMGAAGTRT